MLALYFLAVLLIQAQAAFECPEEIETEILEDFDQIIGNWTYVFHWDDLDDESESESESEEYEVDMQCAKVEITKASEKYIQDKKDSCNAEDDFNWDNARYKFVAPELGLENSLISVGEDSAIMETCGIIASLEVRKISDDYIVMINKENGVIAELLAKKVPSWEELECLDYALDVAEELYGSAICYD